MLPLLCSLAWAQDALHDVIDVHTSVGVMVPSVGSGSVPVAGLGLGTALSAQDTVRLRVLGASPQSSGADPAPVWGSLLELEHRFHPAARVQLVGVWAAGFAAAPSPVSGHRQQVELALHTGLGFRISLQEPREAGGFHLTPVMGVAPRLLHADRLLSIAGPTLGLRLGCEAVADGYRAPVPTSF